MKQLLFLFILIIICFSSFAQSQFGIFAGAQTTTASYKIRDEKQPTEYKYGFHTGFGWKIPFENQLYFSPAAFYSLKGYKVKFNQFAYPPDTAALDNNTTIHTLELAFLLQVDLSKQVNHCFIKFGPSLDFQLSGKEKFMLKTGSMVNRSMLYDFAAYGRYGANFLFQFGFETGGGFLISGQYTHGLTNLNNADHGPNIQHRAYGITIGKYFSRNKIVLDTKNKE